MNLYINGQKIHLKPSQSIGKGGEADVYSWGQKQALKLFKSPDHPDYKHSIAEQQAARDRIAEHQQKLQHFPKNLPSRVMIPQEFVTNAQGDRILGYTMQRVEGAELLIRYSDRAFRKAGIHHQTIVNIFLDLHTTLKGIHQAGVIVGDFNDLNVLVRGTDTYFIDADSFQFGSFLCRVFSAKFLDPLVCDKQEKIPSLNQPYSPFCDWYAFAVMLMQCLVFVHPYGGVYQPQDSSKWIPHEARPLHRISVFHPDVKYPKPAIPYQVLSDELVHYFYQVFVKDHRSEFPRSLLENLHWQTCGQCGIEHTRTHCPICTQLTAVFPAFSTVRGQVTSTLIFSTKGTILSTVWQNKQLRWIYHEQSEFKRENHAVILQGNLDPNLQFWIQGNSTFIGKYGQVVPLNVPEKTRLNTVKERIAVDTFGNLSIFEANQNGCYWIYNGQLLRQGFLGSEYIGDVLAGQTLFWVGSDFGFGYYRAGNINSAFVFDAHKKGLNDRVKLPPYSGQIFQSTCYFSRDHAWFFWSTQEQGYILNRCAIIHSDGSVQATAAAKAGDGSWLSTITGKSAAGNFLLAATDEGIVRVEVHKGQIVKTQEFPDTESFVDTSCQIFATEGGLYVVKENEICLLKITQ